MEGGVKKWIDGMPENILADQFPQTPLLYLKEDLINAFFAQRADRERQIDLALQMLAMEEDEDVKAAILNTAFDQHYDQCTPSFGRPCQYKRICFGQVTEPLKEGWAYREPHHMLELDTQEQELVNT
jgi:hypothetical protein